MTEPCFCRRPAVMEKAGRIVCAICASYLKGREFPLRGPKEVSANCVEMGTFFLARRASTKLVLGTTLRMYT